MSQANACLLLDTHIVSKGKLVLVHLSTHAEYVTWFWSIIAAGGIPVISTPLAADPTAKARHLDHLQRLLGNPKVLTTKKLKNQFHGIKDLEIVTVESIPDLYEEVKSQT